MTKNVFYLTRQSGFWLLNMVMRPLCLACNQRPRAINCVRKDKTYYLKKCSVCARKNKRIPAAIPRWQASGYKKKMSCDVCGFRAKYASQTLVYHVDGNLHNSELRNLKTICRNCVEVVKRDDLPWRPGDLSPDV